MLVYILYNAIQYPIDVETSDVISGIKSKIITLSIAGVTDRDGIELQFNGGVLLDNETLSYYNIQKNDSIDMTYTPAPAPVPVPAPVPAPVPIQQWSSSYNVLIPALILTPCLVLVLVLLATNRMQN
jgi:hypothetical protein